MLLSTTLGSDEVEALESLTLGDVDEVLIDVEDTVEVVSVDVEEMDEVDVSVDEVEVETRGHRALGAGLGSRDLVVHRGLSRSSQPDKDDSGGE